MNSRVLIVLVFTVVSSLAAAIDDTVDVYDLEREVDEERGFRDAMRKVGDGLKKAAPYAKKLIPAVYDALKTREEIDEEERGFKDAMKKIGKKALPIAKKLLPVLVDQLRSRENIDEERGFGDFMKKVGHGIAQGAKKVAPVAKKVIETVAPVAVPIAVGLIGGK